MKILTTLLISLLAFTVLAWVAPAASADDEEHSELHVAMEDLQAGQRSLRKLISDPAQKDACLEVVRNMQRAALTATQNPPAPETELDAKAHAVWRIGYQRQSIMLYTELLSLELAVVEERAEAAAGHYKALGQMKKKGHEAYQHE